MSDARVCRANDRQRLYRWSDDTGQEWACIAYDHGPFCRLCQPVNDAMAESMLDCVELGWLEVQEKVGFHAIEDWLFRLTDAGRRHIEETPELRAAVDDMTFLSIVANLDAPEDGPHER